MSFSGGMYFLAVCGCSRMCCTSCLKASHLGPCLEEVENVGKCWKKYKKRGGCARHNIRYVSTLLTRQLGRPHRQRNRVAGRPCSAAARASRVWVSGPPDPFSGPQCLHSSLNVSLKFRGDCGIYVEFTRYTNSPELYETLYLRKICSENLTRQKLKGFKEQVHKKQQEK